MTRFPHAIRRLIVPAIVAMAGACSDGDNYACLDVQAKPLRELGASAVGVNGDGARYVVASASGAAWLTTIIPALADGSGLILPLNDAARQASDIGVDVSKGAPIYQGIDEDHPAVAAAVECAKSGSGAP